MPNLLGVRRRLAGGIRTPKTCSPHPLIERDVDSENSFRCIPSPSVSGHARIPTHHPPNAEERRWQYWSSLPTPTLGREEPMIGKRCGRRSTGWSPWSGGRGGAIACTLDRDAFQVRQVETRRRG